MPGFSSVDKRFNCLVNQQVLTGANSVNQQEEKWNGEEMFQDFCKSVTDFQNVALYLNGTTI